MVRPERVFGWAPAATDASYETHRTRRREHGTVTLETLQDGVLDIEHSLRWHDPGRFNGYVLSQHFAGTPVDPVNLRDASGAVNLKGRFAMRGVIHHLDLTVSDPDKVFAFYDAILSALGYRLERKSDRGFDWNLQSPLGVHSIGVVKASSEGARRPHDRYSPGLHHVAWGVDSREEVDRMHEVVQRIGAKVLDVPADYPQYNNGGGYYAVFFADPDGLKLECVYTPRPSDA